MIAVFLAKHPKLLLLSIAVIVATGLTSVFVIPRLEDPTLRKRVAVISTVYAGADAQQVESLVTIVLEEQLATISEIKQVRSNSRTNTSNIVIELNDSVNDTDAVWSTVRDRVKDTTTRLPESCGEPKLEIFPLKAFATIVAVTWNRDDDTNWSVMRRITKKLRERLLAIPGTEDLQVFGDSGEEFVAEVTPERLASLGMSTGAIAQQLAGALADQPAGSINSDGSALQLEVIRGGSPEALIKEAPITYGPRGATTTLADIADVRRQIIAPPTYKAIIDDQPAVVLGAMVSDQLRVDHWADEFDLVIEKFAAEHQNDVAIEVLFSQRKQVDLRMNTLLLNLAMGTLAVLVAVLLFMGWRSTLVVSAALPLSALMVLGGMRLLGIPIHQMSITGLIIALGLLIDNAIVIVEEVRAKLVRGETTSTAISESVRHLGMPLFASTLTTALAFLPIATLPGPSGEFVATIAISVILAISASFILSMTIIPAMQSSLYSESPTQGWFGAGITIPLLSRIYQTTLRWIYTVPLFGAAIGLVLPVLGFVAAQQLPQQFFPPSDRQQIQIEIEGSIRDTLQQTEKTSQAVREIVAEHQSVARQYWFLGGSAPTFFYNVVPRRRSTPSYGQAFIDLKSDAEIDRVVRELQAALDREILESRVLVRQLEQGPPFDAPIELRLIGPDFATLHDQGV
ncbi:MAG: efflux RND transporter permease subunit, partial [bacterium]|nr:efflux RND transporter permease subunit [bacterium]